MFLSRDFLKMNSNELVYACVFFRITRFGIKVAIPY